MLQDKQAALLFYISLLGFFLQHVLRNVPLQVSSDGEGLQIMKEFVRRLWQFRISGLA